MTHSHHVNLVQPSDTWQAKFDDEKQRLLNTLVDVDIEHIGSTSIPNLLAKPTIDMIVGVTSASNLKSAQKVLCELGYVAEGERAEHYWLSLPLANDRQYIIHLVIKGGQEWRKRISFRDYLLQHPSAVKEYQALKQRLASEYEHDIDNYTFGKAAFVTHIINLAKADNDPDPRQ